MTHHYLLHPNYQDLFAKDPATTRLRERLLTLANDLDANDALRHGWGWTQVNELLSRLGRRPSEE